jgi:hypothetical protein
VTERHLGRRTAPRLVVERGGIHPDHLVEAIGVGDHPFFQRASNIDYGSAKHFPRVKLENQVNGRGKLRQDVSPALLEKARAGIFRSSRCPNYIKEYFETRFDTTGQPIP